MAKEGQAQTGQLAALTEAVRSAGKGIPPVHLWNPPYCGEIDLRIAADGTWYYQKTPIGRPALVQLFASVLKREGDRYYLVTPVEKCGIVVDDAPFVAVGLTVASAPEGQTLTFTTNVGDAVMCGSSHPLRFEPEAGSGGLKPYLHVRRDLWALVNRAIYYDLVEIGEERAMNGVVWYGIASQGEFYPMMPADTLRELS
jgi:hypothetical protein